jgi:hypothetical protein
MSVSSCDILRQEMGEGSFKLHIEYHIKDFHEQLKNDSANRIIQNAVTSISFIVSTAIAGMLMKGKIELIRAGFYEGGVIAIGFGINRFIQHDRNYYQAKAEECIEKIRRAVPEKCRLIAESFMMESDVYEEKIPEPEAARGIKYFRKAAVHAVEQTAPYLLTFFG